MCGSQTTNWKFSWKRGWRWERQSARRRSGQQRVRRSDRSTGSAEIIPSKRWETVEDRRARSAAVHEVAKSQAWLSGWTTGTLRLFTKRVAFLGIGLPSKPVTGIGWGSPVLVKLCAQHLTLLGCQLTAPPCKPPAGTGRPPRFRPWRCRGADRSSQATRPQPSQSSARLHSPFPGCSQEGASS